VVSDQGGGKAPVKKDTILLRPTSGVTFFDAKGKKEEGPETVLSPGRMTRSNYSKVANVRISSEANTVAFSSAARLDSPTSRVTTPAATQRPAQATMFKDRISSL
jgi:hypothetical protein